MYLKLSSPTFYNTLIWNNLATQGSQIYLEDQFSDPNFYYCDLHGGLGSIFIESGSYNGQYENCLSLNPLFQMPTFAQGATYPASSAIWDLLPNSPCINAGDHEGVPLTIPETDLDGKDRIIVAAEVEPRNWDRRRRSKWSQNPCPKMCIKMVLIKLFYSVTHLNYVM